MSGVAGGGRGLDMLLLFAFLFVCLFVRLLEGMEVSRVVFLVFLVF